MTEKVQLGEIVSHVKGKPPEKSSNSADLISLLSPDYLRGKTQAEMIPYSSNLILVKKGDLLLLWDGSNAGEFFQSKDGALASTMVKLNVHNGSIEEPYLYYALKNYEGYLKAQTRGSGIPHVDPDLLYNLRINIFTKSERTKIANILTTVDKAIEQTETLIAKYEKIKTGLMQDLLTKGIDENGKIRSEETHEFKYSPLGRIPVEWETISVKEFASQNDHSIVDGPFGSNLKRIHYKDKGIPIIQSGFVTNNKFFANRYLFVTKEKFKMEIRSRVVPGDLVMAKIGAQCGKCALLPENHPVGIIAGNCLKVTISKNNSNDFLEILFHYLYSIEKFDEIITTTAQPAVSMQSLKKMNIVRPLLKEQLRIVSVFKGLDKMIHDETENLIKNQKIKMGLMQDLLKGKVRVNKLIKN